MEWTQVLTGIGIGTLGAKVLDILWLQRRTEDDRHRAWLREQRLEAFAQVTRELISFGLHEKDKGPFEMYGSISKALLLIDDDGLIRRIDHFVVDLARLNDRIDSGPEAPGTEGEGERMYHKLLQESREITKLLRNVLIHGRVSTY